ncbi:unnamed protein product, partial [Symbiodinium sp. CCMP2592]
ITPDQQSSRYKQRAKRAILDTYPMDCPLEKAPRILEPDRGSMVAPLLRGPSSVLPGFAPSQAAGPSSGGGAGAVASDNPPASVRIGLSDDEDDEAEMLGIQGEKKKRKSDAKKVSESEKLLKEFGDLDTEFRNLLAELRSFPPTLPDKFGYSLGKVDRAATKLLGNLKKANAFESLPSLNTMIDQIASTRDLIKVSGNFFSGKSGMNKKHEEPFYNLFKKVQAAHPLVIASFNPLLETRFIEVGYSRDMKSSDWPSVAGYVALQKQIEVHGGDEEAGEKGSIALAEKLVSYLVEELPKCEEAGGEPDLVLDYVKKKFLEATEEILNKNPGEKVSEAFNRLRMLMLLNSDGESTMDETMKYVEDSSKPVVRVFLSAQFGKKFVELGQEANHGMQARAMINVSIHSSTQEIFGLATLAEWEEYKRSPNQHHAEALNSSSFFDSLAGMCAKVVSLVSEQSDEFLQQTNTVQMLRDLTALLGEAVSTILASFREKMATCCVAILSDHPLDIMQECWVFPMGPDFVMFGKLHTSGYEKLQRLCCRCQGVKFPSNDLHAITSFANLLHGLHDVLEPTNAQDQTFVAWQEGVPDFVVQATSEKTRAIGLAFQKFCEKVDAMPNRSFQGLDGMPKNADDVVRKCKDVQKSLLPEIFTAMTEHFHSVNLEMQDWFVEAVRPGAVIPEAQVDKREVLNKAATFDLPSEEFSCLSGMSETLKRSKIDVEASTKGCAQAFARTTVLVYACSFRYACMTKNWQDENKPTHDEIADFIEVFEKDLHQIVNGLLQFQKTASSEDASMLIKQVESIVIPTVTMILKHHESLMNESINALPSQYEVWLSNRSIQKIKSAMLNREKHSQICGKLDSLARVSGVLQKSLDSLSAFGVCPQTDLSRFRTTLQNLKSLKTYSATVHGVNLVLFRLPKESQNRNKAALVRE